jgi:hypothetical protein
MRLRPGTGQIRLRLLMILSKAEIESKILTDF